MSPIISHNLSCRVLKCVAILGVVLGLFSIGCGDGRKLPANLPKRYPCKITVIQDGKPLADATVALRPMDNTSAEWLAVGATDSDGTVALQTQGLYPGVIAGKFKVVIYKQETEPGPPPKPGTPMYQAVMAGETSVPDLIFDVVDTKYGTPKSTPLEIEVNGAMTATFNVGAAVRLKQPSL